VWVPRFLSLAVYRHQLRPVIETAVIAMNTIMNRKGNNQSNQLLGRPFGSHDETYIRRLKTVMDFSQ